MAGVKRGCLVIADIGGYTKYLSGTELEHSQDILADVIGSVVDSLAHGFRLAKLEGDAVFCYSEDDGPDPHLLVASIESAYFAFSKRQRSIVGLTTCVCDACRHIPDLHLKFAVHHGSFVEHQVAGHSELVGSDVILVHRLLKNSIVKATGVKGYAFITERCVALAHLEPEPLGMIEHREAYDDVGDISGWVLDLESRWVDEQARENVRVGDDDSWVSAEYEAEGTPAYLWDAVSSPKRQQQWMFGVVGMDESLPGGIRGAGATVHCMHGDGSSTHMEIIDWKPFRYFTVRASSNEMPDSLWTTELIPIPEGRSRIVRRAKLVDMSNAGELEELRQMLAMVQDESFRSLGEALEKKSASAAS